MSPQNNHLQRPPAAVLYADELANLTANRAGKERYHFV
ncbi:hypothetical protein ACUODJ_40495, partial [Escherichia sp. HC-CC]